MTRPPRALALVAAAAALTTAVSGCGGGTKTASADEWAGALCGALAKLPDHAQALQTGFAAQAQRLQSDPKGARDDFATSLDEIAKDFSAGRKALDDAGRPKVDKGEEIQKTTLEGLDKVEKVFSDAADKVRKTEPTAAALGAASTDVLKSLSAGFTEFGNTFDGLDSKSAEIKKAGETNADCKKLNG